MLVGRQRELTVISDLLDQARLGMSAALVIRGEAGVGKTALLRHVVSSAADFEIATVSGFESEVDLGFATLHRLLLPFSSAIEELPVPQRDALASAFGLRDGAPPDPFLVGLAALTLLTDVAASRQLVCVIDDAQWIDEASLSILTFVARRLHADRMVMLFGFRTAEQSVGATDGLPVLSLGELDRAEVHALLRATPEAPFHDSVVSRLADEAGGNPLAVLELARALSPDERTGTTPLADQLRIGADVEAQYVSMVRALPQATQDLLLLAAAEPGEPEQVRLAAEGQGLLTDEVLAPAEIADLVVARHDMEFRHPLIRSAVYQGASLAERQRAHRVLASVMDASHADRRAWHLASASLGRDAEVADALDLAAERARNRGGRMAEVKFLDRAAELTPDPVTRARRLISAAQAAHLAGSATLTSSLVDKAEQADPDGVQSGHAMRLRGLVDLVGGRFRESTGKLLAAARSLAPHDRSLARETLLDTFVSQAMTGRYVEGIRAEDIAWFALGLPADDPDAPCELLLAGWSNLFVGRRTEAVPLLRRATRAFASQDELRDASARWALLVSLGARELWDDETYMAVNGRNVQRSRELGDLTTLQIALLSLAAGHVHRGSLAEAQACYAEVRLVKGAIAGSSDLNEVADLQYRAWRGNDPALRGTAHDIFEFSDAIGFGSGVCIAQLALTTAELSDGHYEAALDAARAALGGVNPGIECRALVEIVEAAHRSGEHDVAQDALDRVAPSLLDSETDWGLGVLARLNGLMAADEDADLHFAEAIERLGRTAIRTDTARSHLLYGEWLRRQQRRTEARDQLHAAHELFASIGAEGYAERAHRELLATGERARRRQIGTSNDLTPQEQQVARLAADGLTNREIASQLFLSASTVDYHLRKTFRKLDITSRHQLVNVLHS